MHRCGLVADDELRALGGEAQRARAADAAARARDDRDLAVQCAHHAPPEIVAPPSHTMVWPVVKAPALLARKTAAPAISCGSPMRFSVEAAVDRSRFSGFSHSARAMSVRIRPGAMQLTRTPRSEEHTSELQSLMRISYAVFCL